MNPVPRLSSHPALVHGTLLSGRDEGTSATQVMKYRLTTEKEVHVERFRDLRMNGQFFSLEAPVSFFLFSFFFLHPI